MKIFIIEVINLNQWSDGTTNYMLIREKNTLFFKANMAPSLEKRQQRELLERPFKFMTIVSASRLI